MGVEDDLVRTVRSGVAAHLLSPASRALQATAKGAAVVAAEAERQDYYQRIDLTPTQFTGDTLEIVLDRSIAKEPELFYGPFLQLGTYLELENPFLRIGLDIVADPLSWVPVDLGLSRLNKVGKLGRLLSSVTQGGRVAMTPEKAVAKLETVITEFGRLSAMPEAVAKLKSTAGKLTSGEFRSVVSALEKAEVPKHFSEILSVIKQDRKSFVDLLKLAKSEKASKLAFTGGDLLQPTFRSQLAAGQRTIIEFHKPFTATKALLGSGYRDHVLWRPMVPALFMPERGAKALGDDLTRSIATSLSDEFSLEGKFQPDPTKAFDWSYEDFALAVDDLEIARMPTGHELIYGDALSDDRLLAQWNEAHPTNPRGEGWIESDEFKRYKSQRVEKLEEFLGLQAEQNKKMREVAIAKWEAAAAPRLEAIAKKSGLVSADEVAGFVSDRLEGARIRRAAMAPEQIAQGSAGWDIDLAGAAKEQRRAISSLTLSARYGMAQSYKNAAEREKMTEAWRYMVEYGADFFTKNEQGRGKLVASMDDIQKKSPFFHDFLLKNPDVDQLLRTEGATTPVTEMAERIIKLNESLGTQFMVSDHIIPEYVGNYFSRVGRFTRKGRKANHLDVGATDTEIGHAILNPVEEMDGLLDRVATGGKGGESKLTMTQLRSSMESELLRWEKKGWYVREKDPIYVLGEYLDATTTALLNNDMFMKLPKLLGKVDETDVARLVANGISEKDARGLAGLERLTYKEPKKSVQGYYRQLRPKRRHGVPTIDDVAELSELRLGQSVGDSLNGLSEVGGVKVVDKVTGQPILLDSGWIQTGSYPDRIKNVKEVKAAVKREIASRIAKREAEIAETLVDVTDTGRVIAKDRGLQSVWVLKPYANEINAAFRHWSSEGMASAKSWRWFDNLNAQLKGTVLAIDAFHGNVLTAASLMLNPVKMAEVLAMEHTVFKGGLAGAKLAATRFLPRTAVGAVGGAVGAIGLGADEPGEVAAGSLVGALWANALTAAIRNGILNQRAMMTPGTSKAMAYMGLAGWNGRPNDRSIGIIGRALSSMADGLRKKGAPGALIHPLDGLRHVEEGFNQVLWETIHNGAKSTYFQARLAQWEKARLLKGSARTIVGGIDQEMLAASKEILQSSDVFFGGMNYARLYSNPEMQATLRRFLLSPDWTSGRLLGAANMMLNMSAPAVVASSAVAGTAFEAATHGFEMDEITGKGAVFGGGLGLLLQQWAQRVNTRMLTPGDIMAKESRKLYSAALLGGYFIANLLNYAFTGHYMWQNEEGDKLKVVMPDGSRVGFGKAYKEAFEFTGADEHLGVPIQSRVASKLSVPIKLGIEIMSNKSWNGPIVMADANPLELAGGYASYFAGSVTPIFASGPIRETAAAISGTRSVGSAATSAIIRGVGIGLTPPKRDYREPIREGLRALAGLPSIGSAGLSSLTMNQRNLR